MQSSETSGASEAFNLGLGALCTSGIKKGTEGVNPRSLVVGLAFDGTLLSASCGVLGGRTVVASSPVRVA